LISTVNIFPAFDINLVTGQNPVCAGNAVNLDAIADPLSAVIVNYSFSGSFGNQAGPSDQFSIPALNSTGQVNVVATNNHGCEATDNIDLQIATGPVLMQNAFNFCETDNTPINLSTLLQDPSGNFITSAQWTIFDSGSSSWIIPSVINSINVDSIIQQFGPINSPSENFDLNYSYTDPLSGC
jgi:hypothetical protein